MFRSSSRDRSVDRAAMEASGGTEKERDKEKEKDKEKDKEKVVKRRIRPVFLRYLDRRKTDSIVDDDIAVGDINLGTLVRRSQSDKTEYSAKLKEKMTPSALSMPLPPDSEEVRCRKMSRRAKVIQELVQTEKDYLTDMELCVREVVKPLRELQVVDVDRLFTNMEAACEVSAALVLQLQEATAEPDLEAVVIGDIFIQAKGALEDVYKIYCYHHDEANQLLKTYERDEEIKQHLNTCILSLKQIYDLEGKPNLLNMGSLLIKPVQRIMKYPLLLGELWQATPNDHPDYLPLQEAYTAIKIINVNINEFKRRKDIVMKYKRADDEGSLRERLQKINIRSIRKKGDRFAGYLKILAGAESQVKDEAFDKEEKLFRSLEKAVKQLVKDVHFYLQQAQEMVAVAVHNVQDLEIIVKDSHKHITNGTHHENTPDPYKHFKEQLERLVLTPLTCLQGMFSAPQKLIQKRYDKLLDYCSRLERSSSFNSTFSSTYSSSNPSSSSRSSSSPSPSSSTPSPVSDAHLPARRDYVALNGQLVEELQRFNAAAYTVLVNCVVFLVALLRGLTDTTRHNIPSKHQLPAPLSNINEVQNSLMDELNNLTFVKDNAQKMMERKVSFERQREKKPMVEEVQHQTEPDRVWLLSEYPASQLYQLKRKCNGSQEQDLSLLEGDLVALLEDSDPHGSSSRWLVHTGGTQGYVYSTFLKQYNPLRDVTRTGQSVVEQPQEQLVDEDFDNLSLFVSGSGNSSLRSFSLHTADSGSILSGLQGELEGLQDLEESVDEDPQQFYAVHAFQARCEQELTLQEYQHVRILQFSDQGGNKDWWLAEAHGQKGYVPANYLGKMSYA
ncbi:rho guanine nucleotide exchange factor 38 [Gadus chalcogrammus]|uniref:rho guanine nucleotide exchange factor 38 n=1 Tax=Gadus chalcogrammus TaxID=1042646 RepID=UPI0024C28793|nr:rho guanine nucleotide exchange factor 38 [Gadus chalcogrammus]